MIARVNLRQKEVKRKTFEEEHTQEMARGSAPSGGHIQLLILIVALSAEESRSKQSKSLACFQ